MTSECFNFYGTAGPTIDWIRLKVIVIGSTHAVDLAKKASLPLRTSSAFEMLYFLSSWACIKSTLFNIGVVMKNQF